VIDDMKRTRRHRRAIRFSQSIHHGVRAARETPGTAARVVAVPALVRRIAGVEPRLSARIAEGPDLTIRADPDQLEQLLINLLHNATDAALQTVGASRSAGSARAQHRVVGRR